MIKTKLLLAALMAVIGFGACCASTPETTKDKDVEPEAVDSTVYHYLGKTLHDLLASPAKVSCYTVIAKDQPDASDLVLEKPYVRNKLVNEKLSKADIAVLQYLLPFDKENYKKDSMVVRSPYLPVLEFCFKRKKQQAHLLISLMDGTWTLVFDNKVQQHLNYEDKRQIARFCKQFFTK